MNLCIFKVSDVIKILFLYMEIQTYAGEYILNEMCLKKKKLIFFFFDETYTICCNSEVLSPLHILEVWSDPQRQNLFIYP